MSGISSIGGSKLATNGIWLIIYGPLNLKIKIIFNELVENKIKFYLNTFVGPINFRQS